MCPPYHRDQPNYVPLPATAGIIDIRYLDDQPISDMHSPAPDQQITLLQSNNIEAKKVIPTFEPIRKKEDWSRVLERGE